MSDKPFAGLVTLATILPLCAVCVLGPAARAIVASLAGWLGGLAPWAILHRGRRRRRRGERSM